MSDVIAAAEAEERELVALLMQNPTYRKLQAVRNLLNVYRTKVDETAPKAAPPRAPTLNVPSYLVPPRRVPMPPPPGMVPTSASNAARIRAVVADYLRRTGRRATSGELLKVAIDAGIDVGGAKPNATMSSYLSGMKEFDNVAGEGYGLVEWTTKTAEESKGSSGDTAPEH
jgi:hypothetical protein